jgi:SAM-dependent methyltransferase
MSDESENEETSAASSAEAGPAEIDVEVLPERASPIPERSSEPNHQRSRPPPKPKSRPSMPAVTVERVRRSSIPLPRPSNPPAEMRAPRSVEVPKSEKRTPASIKPMRMIALGTGARRSEPPASAVERTSFRPPPPDGNHPPAVDARAQAAAELRAPPGAERGAPEPDDYDEVTPALRRAAASAAATADEMPPRAAEASMPDIQVTTDDDEQESTDRVSVEEVPDSEVAPASDEEPHVAEVPDSEVAPASDEEPHVAEAEPDTEAVVADEIEESGVDIAADLDKSRKPPPPPKRARSVPTAPSERAVAQALQAPKFEPKPRARTWWEELFSDDFGRGILPLSDRQIAREVDFIEESLGVAKGGIVMDLACGAGHHAVELSGRGYGVVGFDLSLAQLAIAGEYAQERGQKINFLQGDMREMSFDQVFDGIYCWNTSFGYFEEDKNFAVAERVFAALRPGGSFLLDVVNRDFVVAHQPSQVWFEGDACVCMDDMSVDFITSRLRVKRTMMLDDGRTRETTFSIRVYSLHELGKLLHEIGFRVTEASGHTAYPGVFFGATSPRVVILAQKP